MNQSNENDSIEAEDDLLDDLMNIVQNDIKEKSIDNLNFDQVKDDDEDIDVNSEEEYENDEDIDEIDDMLEKPIDMLEAKDECNYYTYDKIQIKSIQNMLLQFYNTLLIKAII